LPNRPWLSSSFFAAKADGNPQALRGEIATMLGTTPDHIIVHTHPGAGHYGRSNGGNSGAEDDAVILSLADVGRGTTFRAHLSLTI
jgi:hypothetical protein